MKKKFRDISPAELTALRTDLNSCKSIGAMLSVLMDKYDLNNVSIGDITRSAYVTQLMTLLKTFNPTQK